MGIRPPILDTRVLQDVLQLLVSQARVDLPEWTPPAQGDVGTMLQRIFARLMEVAIQRLNQVPEKNLLAFLDAMGVTLLPASPAKVPLVFGLTAGRGPTLVPAGTRAGTKPGGSYPAMTFETTEDYTVIPASITSAFTMDPIWDRFADQMAAIAGNNPAFFTPFVGTERMPHVIYLGDDLLLNFAQATVAVDFDYNLSILESDISTLLEQLTWQCIQNGKITEFPAPILNSSTTHGHVTIRLPKLTQPDQSTVQGVGADLSVVGASSRFIQVVLGVPVHDVSTAMRFPFSDVRIGVSAAGFLPDFALSNTALVDVTKDFFPFGEAPHPGDTFYIGSLEAFSKPDATITLTLQIRPAVPPFLAWDYWNGTAWAPVPASSLQDGTGGFTVSDQNVKLSLPCPGDLAQTIVNYATAFWFRVRIVAGGYRGAPVVSQFKLAPASDATTLAQKVDANGSQISLTDSSFALSGTVLKIGEGATAEFAKVTSVPGQGTFGISPPLLKPHDKDEKVERQGLSSSDALFVDGKKGNTDFFATRGGLPQPGVALIDDPQNPEFVTVTGIVPKLGMWDIAIAEKLQFDHPARTPLRHFTAPDFIGFADGGNIDFTTISSANTFFPFGNKPTPGAVFYFGTSSGFPTTIEIDASLDTTAPEVGLQWEFLGANAWQQFVPSQDDTKGLSKDGSHQIVFPSNPCTLAEVNSKKSCWIRVRVTTGDYGLPVQYVQVSADDPSKGFTVLAGTGTLNPPVITGLTISYQASRNPTSVITQNGFLFADQSLANQGESGFTPFVSVTDLPSPYFDPEPAFYLGLDAKFPQQPVKLWIEAAARVFSGSVMKGAVAAPALLPTFPPLRWEYFNGTAWDRLTVLDGTNNLTESGGLEFLTPTDSQPLAKVDLKQRYWIRARSSANTPSDTQQLDGVYLNAVSSIQAVSISNETLGSSNGQSGQSLRFAQTPVLPGQQVWVLEAEAPSDKERGAIEAEEGTDAVQARLNAVTSSTEIWVRWHEVANFLASDNQSRHYTLDHQSGSLFFGDGTNGMVPPSGVNNLSATYQSGGGAAGNLAAGAITQVKSTVSGVTVVSNPVATDGGADPELASSVKDRGPQTLRNRGRAVSSGDIEWLARQADGTRVARSKCLPDVNRDLRFEPGWVTVLIVPQGTDVKLAPSSELVRQVESYLDSQAFIGLAEQTPARINVIGPGYIQVSVAAEVVPRDLDQAQLVKQNVRDALVAYFHPLTGGSKGTGWEFGRNAYASELSQLLQDVPGVDHLKSLQLIPNITQCGLRCISGTTGEPFFPAGSSAMTITRTKAALIAASTNASTGLLPAKGFKEGDRISRVLDLKVTSASATTLNVTPLDPNQPSKDVVGFPTGSLVMSFDGEQTTELAETILPNEPISTVRLKTPFSPLPDVITLFYPFPMTVTSVAIDVINLTVISVLGSVLTVGPFTSGATDLPIGTVVMISDGTRISRLAEAIGASQVRVTRLVVQDAAFAAALSPGDTLSLRSPSQTLGIEPYQPEFTFPAGAVFARLDNLVRFPLLTELSEDKTNVSVQLNDFTSGEQIQVLSSLSAATASGTDPSPVTLTSVEPVDDIVYLDDNFLIYSGAHQITIVEE